MREAQNDGYWKFSLRLDRMGSNTSACLIPALPCEDEASFIARARTQPGAHDKGSITQSDVWP